MIASSDMNLCIFQDFLNKFQRAEDAMEYNRKTAAESASATVSHQPLLKPLHPDPFHTQISLVIVLTVCYAILMMLFERFWC